MTGLVRMSLSARLFSKAMRPNLAFNLIKFSQINTSSRVLGSKLYTKTHEWVSREEGKNVRIGISDYAQKELGDVVYAELPSQDDELKKGETLVTIESVKAVGEVHSPVTGVVREVNEALQETPGTVNTSPEEEGWLVVMTMSDEAELSEYMSEDEYKKFTAEGQ